MVKSGPCYNMEQIYLLIHGEIGVSVSYIYITFIRDFKKPRRQRQRKRRLKTYVLVTRTSSR